VSIAKCRTLGLAFMSCWTLTLGCGPPAAPDQAELRAWIAKLVSARNGTEFKQACEKLFCGGYAAVPALLEAARDETPVGWTAPTILNRSSLMPRRATRGVVCIYLIESIRVGRLAHSSGRNYSCRAEVAGDSRACAVTEYERWWESVSRGDDPPYTPRVTWEWVSDREIRAYMEANGTVPDPHCRPIVDLSQLTSRPKRSP
jgi:hypothetical protein